MILLLPLLVFQCALISAGDPESFANYFDDSLKGVDIPQDAAIEACVQNGNGLAQKVDGAYDKCFGNDYDFDDLAAAAGGSDKDSDGLPDSFEGNEICFYKQMGWVDASGEASAEAIKADLAGLDADLKASFDASIDECAAWSGNFGARMKREADVPSVMGFGGKALNWLKSMRKKRDAAGKDEKKPGKKEDAKKGGKGKKKAGKRKAGKRKAGKRKAGKRKAGKRKAGKRKAGKRKAGKKKAGKRKAGKRKAGKRKAGKRKAGKRKAGKRKAGKGKAGKRKAGKRKAGKKKAGKRKAGKRKSGKRKAGKRKAGKRKAGKRKAGKGKGKGKKEEKNGENGKSQSNGKKKSGKPDAQKVQESVYNQLWCFDLSMEQVLEKCVERKIKN